jgi:predicted Zn-dependent protease
MTILEGNRGRAGRGGRRVSTTRPGAAAWVLAALVATSACAVAGCTANPATGQRQLNLYTEAEEIEIGRQADQGVVAQLGLAGDADLQAYVSDLGLKLAATSERPQLPWSFKVVDDPAVNAFALPGGFVYVTRGLLAYVHSEAELASVLGHEIGHVTAQHGVHQLSEQQVAAGGLLIGAALVPEVARAADAAQAGLSLLFLKYGRDDERQADDLGLRYTVGAGYDPNQMPEMFRVLEAVSEISGAGRLPNWLATHPDPEERRDRIQREIAERNLSGAEVGEESYLRRLDGLMFGPDPRQGFFEGNVFYHPDLAFEVEFPSGWKVDNEKTQVIATDPDGVAQVSLSIADEKSASEAARAFLAQDGVQTISSRRTRSHGLPTVRADFSVSSSRAISGRAAFVELDQKVFRLLGLVYSDRAGAVRGGFDTFLDSFARLRDRARLGVAPQRIRIVELSRPMSLETFQRKQPSDVDPRVLALINDAYDTEAELPAGTLLKRVEGKRAGSSEPGAGPGG